ESGGVCKAFPAGQGGGKMGAGEVGVGGRFVGLGEFGERRFDELAAPPVTIGVLGPVVGDQDAGGRNRIDRFTFGNEVGIVLVRQGRGEIVVAQGLRKRNRYQTISIARLKLSDRTGRFAGRNKGCGDLALRKLVESVSRAKVDFVNVDIEAAENVPCGHLGAAALGVEIHLASAQLLERGDVGASHEVNFIVGNLHDVDELVLEVAE